MSNPPFFKEAEGQQISERKYLERLKNEDFGTTKLGKLRSYCWNLTEYPETSLAARVSSVATYRLELAGLDNNILVVTLNFIQQTTTNHPHQSPLSHKVDLRQKPGSLKVSHTVIHT